MTLTRTRGDDWTIAGTITNGGTAVNLTGATITAHLRQTTESSTITATFTVAVVSAAAGTITLSLADTVTDDINPGTYVYDIQVVNAGVTTTYGNDGEPLELVVKGDVTR